MKLDPLRPTERIEQLLGIAIQTRLVRDMDRKLATSRGHVRHLLVLRVVGDEPLEVPKRNAFAVTEDIDELFEMLWCIEKSSKRIQKQVAFTHYMS